MIEYRIKRSGVWMAKAEWRKVTKLKNVDFGSCAYRINGKEYYHNTAEFKKHLHETIVWDMLNDAL